VTVRAGVTIADMRHPVTGFCHYCPAPAQNRDHIVARTPAAA
jgi:hypothetical protein